MHKNTRNPRTSHAVVPLVFRFITLCVAASEAFGLPHLTASLLAFKMRALRRWHRVPAAGL